MIDDYGTPEEQRAARESDADTSWTDLIDNPAWEPDGSAALSFLDAIGFRYYLPAVMILSLRRGRDETSLCQTLTLSAPGNGGRKTELARFKALDARQHLCVERYLRYMVALHETLGYHTDAQPWREALESSWQHPPLPAG